MTDLERILKHATLAVHDNEVSSMVILMVNTKGEPEAHIVVSTNAADVFAMNAALDMFKIEMHKVMQQAVEQMKDRE